ncbi:hypothetical protein OK006_4325 [Actinobacteria bacterium OK006]|jgi:hypothetical protein|nr:hypothetical protein OK006_4325 [Actinobacteria bacterium OK006]
MAEGSGRRMPVSASPMPRLGDLFVRIRGGLISGVMVASYLHYGSQ